MRAQKRTVISGVFRISERGPIPSHLPFLLPSPPFPFPSPPLPSPPFCPLPFLPLPLEVGPLIAARGFGGRFSSPSGSGRSPAAKWYLVNFS